MKIIALICILSAVPVVAQNRRGWIDPSGGVAIAAAAAKRDGFPGRVEFPKNPEDAFVPGISENLLAPFQHSQNPKHELRISVTGNPPSFVRQVSYQVTSFTWFRKLFKR